MINVYSRLAGVQRYYIYACCFCFRS